MSALALAVLLGAALDTLLTRLALAHRPQDWALPLEALMLWAVFGLLLLLPARWTGRRLRAPFAAAFGWMAGAVVVHAVMAGAVRVGSGSAMVALKTLAALAGCAAALLLLAWLERRLKDRRWAAVAIAGAALLLLPPLDALRGSEPPPAPAAGSTQPNLLFMVWDTTRADHLQPWGYDRAITPQLAALASRAATWDTAWSATVFTLSSHVSMLTGLPSALHGTTLRRQTVTAETVASQLRAAGYRTGAFVGTSVLAAGHGLERGFEVYDDLVDPEICDLRLWALVHDAQVVLAKFIPPLRGNGNPNRPQDFQRPASEVLASALRFIERPDPRPWFAFINLYDAHWPYLPDKDAQALWVRPYSGVLGGYLFRADDFPKGYRPNDADKAHIADLYDAELWQLDRDVDGFLKPALGGARTTDLLLTADHGESLGEADHWSHDALLTQNTHVPLLLLAPGVPPGPRAEPACGTDVAPTLLDLAGVKAEALPACAGRSLLAGPDPRRIVFEDDFDNEFVSLDHHAALRGGLRLLRRDGKDTLHDALRDPENATDVSAAHGAEFAALRAALDAMLASSIAAGAGGPLTNSDALGALGYTGKN
jgi:arylsulfatase A-like enzyme